MTTSSHKYSSNLIECDLLIKSNGNSNVIGVHPSGNREFGWNDIGTIVIRHVDHLIVGNIQGKRSAT